MIRSFRALAALAALALLAGACTRGLSSGSATNAQPADLFAAMPSLADVQTLLGDSNWIQGPPSFGVRPLDVASMPFNEKFSVAQPFVHLGTAETFAVDLALWDSTSSAKSHMSGLQTAFGTSASGAKVGDQVLYYGSESSGAAPFQTATFVRVGSIIATMAESLKGGFPTVSQLGKIAIKATARLKDVIAGKLHGDPSSASNAAVLPLPGLDITQLGVTRISVEAAMVMIAAPSIEELAQTMRGLGVDDVVFGDFVLNSDTHMAVQASVFTFLVAKDAGDWLALLRGQNPVDQQGIASFYDAAHGRYMFLFASNNRGALLICRSTSDSEAASRACEAPLSRVISAWKLSLG